MSSRLESALSSQLESIASSTIESTIWLTTRTKRRPPHYTDSLWPVFVSLCFCFYLYFSLSRFFSLSLYVSNLLESSTAIRFRHRAARATPRRRILFHCHVKLGNAERSRSQKSRVTSLARSTETNETRTRRQRGGQPV